MINQSPLLSPPLPFPEKVVQFKILCLLVVRTYNKQQERGRKRKTQFGKEMALPIQQNVPKNVCSGGGGRGGKTRSDCARITVELRYMGYVVVHIVSPSVSQQFIYLHVIVHLIKVGRFFLAHGKDLLYHLGKKKKDS